MKNFSLAMFGAAIAGLCGCALFKSEPKPNVLTPEEEVQGWTLLWDGDDPTNGWVDVSAGCSNFTARGWSVVNEALVATPEADPIRTSVPYKDFDLKADYRLAPGAAVRILYFHNAETNADTSISYPLTPLPPEAKYPHAWQSVRIVARRQSITHWLDGRIIDRKKRDDAELQGRIVLAPGGGTVEFRNVKIRTFGKCRFPIGGMAEWLKAAVC